MTGAETSVYTVGQAAARLGCSIRSLYRWEQAGIIPKPNRVENGGVSMRLYSESAIEQIRKSVAGRLTCTAALRGESRSKDIDSAERQRIAFRFAAELGLHEVMHLRHVGDSQEPSLAVFILRHIESLDGTRWSRMAAQLASEPGIAADEKAVRWLGEGIAEIRVCLKGRCYHAAAAMIRNVIEVAIELARDPELVIKGIREFCFAEGPGSAPVELGNRTGMGVGSAEKGLK